MMKNPIFFFVVVVFLGMRCFGQNAKTSFKEDPRISELLQLKAEMTAKNELGGRYSIQLGSFNSLKKAQQIKEDFDEEYGHLPARVKYESPNYKVWVGNFTSRLAAERVFLKVKEQFKSAFVFKPNS